MPKKTFLNGYPLPASDLNTYLMDQSVMTFASDSARTSAIPAPTEGMTTYLEDLNQVQVYNGTAWEGLVTTSNVGSLAPQGNAVINGGFDIWQRGTSTSSRGTLLADRFYNDCDTTFTASQQTFAPGTITTSMGDAKYYFRLAKSAGGTFATVLQFIEDVRTFAGQTVTLSFWAKAGASASFTSRIQQNFGSGGSGAVTAGSTTHTLTTSWQRFTFTVLMPSISGKTIGSNSFVNLEMFAPTSGAVTFDIWGVQLEAGTVATPFKRNAPSIQAELAACQRYYIRYQGTGTSEIGTTAAWSTTTANTRCFAPSTMRVYPTSLEFSGLQIVDTALGIFSVSAATLNGGASNAISLSLTSTGMTQHRPGWLRTADANGYLAFSSEL